MTLHYIQGPRLKAVLKRFGRVSPIHRFKGEDYHWYVVWCWRLGPLAYTETWLARSEFHHGR